MQVGKPGCGRTQGLLVPGLRGETEAAAPPPRTCQVLVTVAPPWAGGFLETGSRCAACPSARGCFVEAEGRAVSLSCLASLPRFPRLCRPPVARGGAFTGPGPKGSAIWPAWVSPPTALDPCSQDTGNCHGGLDDLACDHRGLRTAWPSRGPQALVFLAAHYLQPLLCSLTGYHHCSSLLFKQEPRVILTCSRCPSSKRCWWYCCRRVSGFSSLACIRTSSSVVFHLLVFSSSHPTSSECPEGSRHTAGLFSPAWLLGWHLPTPGDTVPALAVLASS